MFRAIGSFLVFVVATIVFGALALVVTMVHRRSDSIMRFGRLWAAANLWAAGARVEYEGLEHMAAVSPCVYIANHESNIDIWALIRVLPVRTRFVAKQSLFRIPVMGWAMAASGFVPIDRGHRGRAIQSLRRAACRIRDGRSVVLFPEGTRSRDGRLQPFKKGPFHLALRARVPLIPVAIRGSWQVMRPGSVRVKPGPVEVEFLPAVDPTEFLPEDTAGLAALLREKIRRAREAEKVA